MGPLFSLRRPLARRTLVFCHAVVQLGWIVGDALWLLEHAPWMTTTPWQEAWPTLALGVGLLLLAMVGTRLVWELLMVPHHVRAQLQDLVPGGSVVTRSFERRPAVHDPDSAWVNEARPAAPEDDGVIGDARVLESRRKLTPRGDETIRESPRRGTGN